MTDMLVKLYEIQDDWSFLAQQEALGIRIRKSLGSERSLVINWVRDNFGDGWASEAETALCNRPVSCFIAVQNQKVIGFACYDATRLGFFGPGGVAEACRGRGTGKGLLRACLLDMKLAGYGYAIIGGVGPAQFYAKAAGAVEIPGSSPGIYENMLKDNT